MKKISFAIACLLVTAAAHAGVTISSPANGATIPSNTTVVASASAANPVTAMRVYVDNVAGATIAGSAMNAAISLAAGSHHIVVVAWDSTGASYASGVYVTASSSASSFVTSGVTVTSPANGATVGNSVLFQASAASAYPVTAIAIYVDNVEKFSANAASLNTTLALAAGGHYVVVQAWDSTGAVFKTALNITVSTSAVQPFYAANSFWNVPIPSNAAVDANSVNIVSKSLLAYASSANVSNTDAWGAGLAFASATSKVYTVFCTMYCSGDTITFAIPSGAQPSTGSDHHLAVVNGVTELDMWDASYNASNDTWSAGTRMLNAANGWGAACPQGQHCNGAVAAGFALLGGVIRPEEIAQGHIDHALAITTPYTRAAYIACPATHTDGKYADTSALPEGARIQLDPSFNVDAQAWPAWEKVIAKALQVYGAYVADTGGSVSVRGVTDMNLATKWSDAGMPKGPSLSNLPWSSMRVLQIQSCN